MLTVLTITIYHQHMTNTTTETMNETKMNTDAYDGCSDGETKLTIGFFKKTDTLSFTKEEWEAFKYFGDSLLDY